MTEEQIAQRIAQLRAGPAHPTSSSTTAALRGITRRQAYAMAAMTGLLAHEDIRADPARFAELAFTYADAMIRFEAEGK